MGEDSLRLIHMEEPHVSDHPLPKGVAYCLGGHFGGGTPGAGGGGLTGGGPGQHPFLVSHCPGLVI